MGTIKKNFSTNFIKMVDIATLPNEMLEQIVINLRGPDLFRAMKVFTSIDTPGFWNYLIREHYGHPPPFDSLEPKELYIRQYNLYRQIDEILKEKEDQEFVEFRQNFDPLRRLLASKKASIDPEKWANQADYNLRNYLGLKAMDVWPTEGPFAMWNNISSEDLLDLAYQHEDLAMMMEVLDRKEVIFIDYLHKMPHGPVQMNKFWHDLIFYSSLPDAFTQQLLSRNIRIDDEFLDLEEIEELVDLMDQHQIYNASLFRIANRFEIDFHPDYDATMSSIP